MCSAQAWRNTFLQILNSYLVRFIFTSFFYAFIPSTYTNTCWVFPCCECLRTREVSQNSVFVCFQVYLWVNIWHSPLMSLKRKRKTKLDIIRKWQRSNIKIQLFTVRVFCFSDSQSSLKGFLGLLTSWLTLSAHLKLALVLLCSSNTEFPCTLLRLIL